MQLHEELVIPRTMVWFDRARLQRPATRPDAGREDRFRTRLLRLDSWRSFAAWVSEEVTTIVISVSVADEGAHV